MDPDRVIRKQEISKALTFIQSSLAYPEPEGYQDFLTKLVCNLLDEGNTLFRDGEWAEAVREFSEGLNVSRYATGEDIQVPEALLQSLYINRATAYHRMGQYELGVKDCDSALALCKESSRALYRKALCLKELGRYKEAYSCTTDCLLFTRLDKDVNELAQDLAVHLGLKNRKPYISAKEHTLLSRGVTNGNTTEDNMASAGRSGDGLNPLSGFAPVSFPSLPQSAVRPMSPNGCQPVIPSVPDRVGTDVVEDSELMGADLDSLLDGFSTQHETSVHAAYTAPSTSTLRVPSALPPPTPQLPPAFFSAAVGQLTALDSFSGLGHSTTSGELDTLDDLSTSPGLDALDDFTGVGAGFGVTSAALQTLNGLDSLDDFVGTAPCSSAAASAEKITFPKTKLDSSLDELDDLDTVCEPVDVPTFGAKAADQLDSLDVLDSFSSVEGAGPALPAVNGRTGLDFISDFIRAGAPGSPSAVAPVRTSPPNNNRERKHKELVSGSNPLSSTHEFLQACSTCFPREGQGIYSFVHKPDLVHICNRNILLCRRKAASPSKWTRVREMPPNTSFRGPFVLCREVLNSELGLCKYREQCTFAYNQLEIDVWTEERKGTLDRNLLFETGPVKLDPITRVTQLIKEHKGTFLFLCQECFDGKPRIISNRCRDNVCSNLDVHHCFDANKCLAFVVKTHNVNYRKIRPLTGLRQLDICFQAVRYGCQREDSCHHAHSVIELKTWKVQRDTGLSPEEIVKIATKYHNNQEQNSNIQKWNKSPGGDGFKPKGAKCLNMQIKLACAQCWKDGLISEPDKALKYCTAKARHIWTKDRRVLLVKSLERQKWIQVRPLPNAKIHPVQYEMCVQILKKKTCNYIRKCSFAHSQEEKDIWTYMKNNDLQDIQQVYDTWLKSNGQNLRADGAALTQSVPEEKYIVMPTDFAEPMSGFHCRLCGKHSNSERQWQNHISTEKHKERVFSCEGEDEALTWLYRFPGAKFELCPKLAGGCADGMSCDYAHSPEELKEWIERRAFLQQKLAKAREEMLIMPDEHDFGMYNYLLED